MAEIDIMSEQEKDMTSKLDVVREWTDLPGDDPEAGAAYISDDFQNVDKEGNVVMNKEQWVGMNHMLLASFTDWKFVRSDLREEGDFVIMSGHFEGRHTDDLDLSAMGMGVIPANGKEIVWPEADSKITVEGGKIAKLEETGDSGGMENFIAALM
jgi:predicted ester cyclase